MDPNHRKLLQSNRVMLVNDLVIDEPFLSGFVAADLFTESMYDEVLHAKPTRAGKAGHFLDLLVRRGPEAYHAFISALVETKQFGVAKILDPQLTAQLRSKEPSNAPSNSRVVHPLEESGAKSMQTSETLDEQPIMSELIRGMKCVNVEDSVTISHLKEVNLGDIYDLRKKPRGRALIINNSEFVKLPSRAGASFDGTNLCELFESLFFHTELHENLTALQMKQTLVRETSRKEHQDADAFVLCILSHGARGVVYGSDANEVEIDKHILQVFNGKVCSSLIHKPKVIIIQACQGEGEAVAIQSDGFPKEEDAEEAKLAEVMKNLTIGDTQDSVPELWGTHELADMLIAYATCPGYKSFRQTNLGSWFVRSLIEKICAHGVEEHLADILTRVRRDVLEKKTNPLWFDKPHSIQLTETRTTLTKRLYLFPGYVESVM